MTPISLKEIDTRAPKEFDKQKQKKRRQPFLRSWMSFKIFCMLKINIPY